MEVPYLSGLAEKGGKENNLDFLAIMVKMCSARYIKFSCNSPELAFFA